MTKRNKTGSKLSDQIDEAYQRWLAKQPKTAPPKSWRPRGKKKHEPTKRD